MQAVLYPTDSFIHSHLPDCTKIYPSLSLLQDLMTYLETVLGSVACINASFLRANNAHFGCNTKVPGVDLAKAVEAFTLVSRFENSTLKELVSTFYYEV